MPNHTTATPGAQRRVDVLLRNEQLLAELDDLARGDVLVVFSGAAAQPVIAALGRVAVSGRGAAMRVAARDVRVLGRVLRAAFGRATERALYAAERPDHVRVVVVDDHGWTVASVPQHPRVAA